MSDFADTLRQLRVRGHLSQAGLARLCGLDHSYVSRLERGTRGPSRNVVALICAALYLNDEDAETLYRSAEFIGSRASISDPLALQVQSLMVTASDRYRETCREVISALVAGGH